MTGQVQCPNCGGYKTETHTTLVDKKSGRPLIIQPQAAMWMIVFATTFCLTGFLTLVIWKDQSPWLCLGSMFLASIILFVLPISEYGLKRPWSEAGYEVYHYRCYLCGYEWSRREDEPLPPVTVRPDLIAKGAQKLEEEERERRRRDEEAAAWAHYQRQKRK
jgi:rubredoxin